MSSWWNFIEKLALTYGCEYCGQPAGYWCLTKSEKAASYLHGVRTRALQQAWSDGYSEGRRDERELIELRKAMTG